VYSYLPKVVYCYLPITRSEVKRRRCFTSASEHITKVVELLLLLYALILCLCFIQCEGFFIYIGYTTDLVARKRKHDLGGVKSTAPRRPLELIYCEYFLFKTEAKSREGYSKTSMGRKAIKLMLSGASNNIGYRGSLKELKIEFSTSEPDKRRKQKAFSVKTG
jgi:putative endonuclease